MCVCSLCEFKIYKKKIQFHLYFRCSDCGDDGANCFVSLEKNFQFALHFFLFHKVDNLVFIFSVGAVLPPPPRPRDTRDL